VHVRAARFPDSPLWLRLGRAGTDVKSFGRVVLGRPCQLVRAGHSGATRWGGSFGRTSTYQKLLSCDPRLALCTFVQLIFPALPCGFVSVVQARTQNRSVGSFEGARVNSFGRVVWAQLVQVPSFRSCRRRCKIIRSGRLRAPASAHSGGSFGRGRAGAKEPVSKNAKL